MNKEWQIIIAGSGGQGLMLAGSILSKTATQKENRNATQRSYYGPEKRGGYANSEVKISDEEIIFPSVETADAIILLHQNAVKAFEGAQLERTTVIYDSSCVDVSALGSKPERALGVPMTELARSIGAVQSVNIIALGVLCAATGAVSREKLLETVLEALPKKAEQNRQAFELGMSSIHASEKLVS